MRFRRARCVPVITLLSCACLAGCASYATPGRAADLQVFGVSREAQTDSGIARSLEKQPLASFPTAVAVARVQATDYRSDTASTFGGGRYCVVTTRDIEGDAQVER